MIQYPFQLFEKLPSQDADDLRAQLIAIYYEDNPDVMREVTEKAQGDPTKIQVFQDEGINLLLSTDYAYSIDILNKRADDRIAQILVEAMDKYNMELQGTAPQTE
jgi:hypothetical protein